MPVNRNQVVVAALAATNLNGIAASQSLGAAGALTLNGTLASGGVANALTALGLAQNVVLTSAGNDSTLTWMITGFDYGNSPLSETLLGGNVAAVTSLYAYASVTSIKGSKATNSTVTAGVSGDVVSPWLILGADAGNFAHTLRAFIESGSVSYDIQATSDPILMREVGGYADDIATLQSAQSANYVSYNTSGWIAYRLKCYQAGGSGVVALRVMPTRTV